MADVKLDDLGHGGNETRRLIVEAVAGVAFESERRSLRGGGLDAAEFIIGQGGLAPLARVAPGAGMQLDNRGAEFGAGFQRLLRGLDEHRDPDARPCQFGDEGPQRPEPADHVEAALGGALGPLFRNDATGVRTDAQGDVEHRLGRGHFKIERLFDRRLEPPHVVVVDVAAILAQMRGDAVGAGLDRKKRRAHGIGDGAATRVADGRDMVDVDAKPQRCHRVAPPRAQEFAGAQAAAPIARLPGFTGGSAASSGGSASAA